MSSSVYKSVVALTGGVGSGKTAVAALLAESGAVVVSADELARDAVCPGSKALSEIASIFGPQFIDDTGSLKRQELAKLVFSNPEKRALLEQITHPIIRELAYAKFEEAINSGATPIIYDCPLFFESQVDKLGFRAVIVVNADEETCIERITERNNVSREKAKMRMDAQMALTDKIKKADFLINNNGTLVDLNQKVKQLLTKLKSLGG